MHFLIALLLAFTPATLDLPPEGWEPAAVLVPPVATQQAERGPAVQMTETSPPPTEVRSRKRGR